jgi:hypothetical protein
MNQEDLITWQIGALLIAAEGVPTDPTLYLDALLGRPAGTGIGFILRCHDQNKYIIGFKQFISTLEYCVDNLGKDILKDATGNQVPVQWLRSTTLPASFCLAHAFMLPTLTPGATKITVNGNIKVAITDAIEDMEEHDLGSIEIKVGPLNLQGLDIKIAAVEKGILNNPEVQLRVNLELRDAAIDRVYSIEFLDDNGQSLNPNFSVLNLEPQSALDPHIMIYSFPQEFPSADVKIVLRKNVEIVNVHFAAEVGVGLPAVTVG